MRLHHYSIRTEKSYWFWIHNFIRFHQLQYSQELGSAEVNAFLTRLAAERNVLPIDNQKISTATMLSNG
ncbi:phage integrase N-terminal SAM-like domain-containing protein [Aeromonas caviae]